MSKPLIPFYLHPKSWGLNGTDYKEAEARYNYSGIDLEKKLAEIKLSDKDLARELVNIDFSHSKIDAFTRDMLLLQIDGKHEDDRSLLELHHNHHRLSDYEYEIGLAKLDFTGPARAKAILEIDCRHDRIDEYDRDVKIAKLESTGNKREQALLDIDLKHEKIDAYEHGTKSIELATKAGPERDKAMLDLDHQHGKIADIDYALKVAELTITDEETREATLLKIRHEHGKISDNEYEKGMATLKNEPWIGIIDSGFDPEKGVNGVYFEFDWNEPWITYLRANGYAGPTDAIVVDMWFADVCRAQGLNAQNGYGVVPFSL